MKSIQVAIAVIHFKDQYLLGFRNAKQHQGHRYEFIGGKVETNETATEALMREIYEEVGLDLNKSESINALGILKHYYADNNQHSNRKKSENGKTVNLHVFRVTLSKQQYLEFSNRKRGCEGQPLQWIDLQDLIANKYRLPDANKTLLQWLKLPEVISITLDINSLDIDSLYDSSNINKKDTLNEAHLNKTDLIVEKAEDLVLQNHKALVTIKNWVVYYQNKLAINACTYIRLKQLGTSKQGLQLQAKIISELIKVRPDLTLIVEYKLANHLAGTGSLPNQVIAQHVTQNSLNTWSIDKPLQIVSNLPLTVSSHDQSSINLANELAQYQLDYDLPPVIGLFLSPVKPTKTHPDTVALGWEKFELLAKFSEVPVIALGGMSPVDLKLVRLHGGDKVAGIRHFLT